MNAALHPAEDMQRVAEVGAREVARQKRKQRLWIAVFVVLIPVSAVLIAWIAMLETAR